MKFFGIKSTKREYSIYFLLLFIHDVSPIEIKNIKKECQQCIIYAHKK